MTQSRKGEKKPELKDIKYLGKMLAKQPRFQSMIEAETERAEYFWEKMRQAHNEAVEKAIKKLPGEIKKLDIAVPAVDMEYMNGRLTGWNNYRNYAIENLKKLLKK